MLAQNPGVLAQPSAHGTDAPRRASSQGHSILLSLAGGMQGLRSGQRLQLHE